MSFWTTNTISPAISANVIIESMTANCQRIKCKIVREREEGRREGERREYREGG